MALRAEMGRFRVLLFRDDREWLLQSRDLKPLNRYFPELESTILEQLPSRAVVDGEVVIAGEAGLDFEALQLRVHPAASRVKLLSEESPASLARWDLLCEGDEDLRAQPFADRRARLERALAHAPGPSSRDTDHPRARGRRQLVRAVRRRWTGRRHGQAERRDRCARQAHNAQGQAAASSFCAESVDRDPARSTICQEEVTGRVQMTRPR